MEILRKLKDAVLAVLPVVVVVFVLFFTKTLSLNTNEVVVFSISAALVIFGMFLFNKGAESSMGKMGELVGSTITKKGKLVYLIIIFFLFGLFITIAEPDLSVLASQVNISSVILMLAIGIGVGVFCVIGAIRILKDKSLQLWLLACYGLMFALATIVPSSLLPVAFDAGGVTTGPITVPFILAIGIGLSSTHRGRGSKDSFGLVAFSSIGPIIAVMILSLVIQKSSTYVFKSSEIKAILSSFTSVLLPDFSNGLDLEMQGTLLEVLMCLLPIVLFFLVYNFVFLKLPTKQLLRLLGGTLYVYFGLVLFMTAVEAGFLPIGQKLGINLADTKWLLVLIGALLGIGAALAEPAVHVLMEQIETVSDGAVSKKSVLLALVIGNGLAVALAMLRIIHPEIKLLYVLVPGYVIAFALSFLVPHLYTAIAFDSGGVVSGPMNTTFIMPFAIGACYMINSGSERIMTDAFGTVALVAMMPLISIQLLGLVASGKERRAMKIARSRIREEFDDQIIHF